MKNLIKSIIGVATLSILVKVISFIREILIGYSYGISEKADAIVLMLMLPTIIFPALVGGVGTALLPLLKKDKNQQTTLINILILTTVLSALLAILMIFFDNLIINYIVGEANEIVKTIVVKNFYLIVFSFPILALISLLVSYTQFLGFHFVANATNIISPVCVNFGLIFYKDELENIILMFIIGLIIQLIFLFGFIVLKWNYKMPIFNGYFKSDSKSFLVLFSPILVSMGVQQVIVVIDRTFALMHGSGGVAALNYATKLNGLVFGLVSFAIISVVYPKLVKSKADETLVVNSFYLVIVTLFPFIVFFSYFRSDIITVLFQRGAFNEDAVNLTSSLVLFYCFGMLFFAMRDLVIKIYYSHKNSMVPMYNGIITTIVNIILNFIFFSWFGINGIPLATTLSISLTTLYMLWDINRKYYPNIFRLFIEKYSKNIGLVISLNSILILIIHFTVEPLLNNINFNFVFTKLFICLLILLISNLIIIKKSFKNKGIEKNPNLPINQ